MKKRNWKHYDCASKVTGIDMTKEQLGETLEQLLKMPITKDVLNSLGESIQHGFNQGYIYLSTGKNLIDYQKLAGKKWSEFKEKEGKIVHNNYKKMRNGVLIE